MNNIYVFGELTLQDQEVMFTKKYVFRENRYLIGAGYQSLSYTTSMKHVPRVTYAETCWGWNPSWHSLWHVLSLVVLCFRCTAQIEGRHFVVQTSMKHVPRVTYAETCWGWNPSWHSLWHVLSLVVLCFRCTAQIEGRHFFSTTVEIMIHAVTYAETCWGRTPSWHSLWHVLSWSRLSLYFKPNSTEG